MTYSPTKSAFIERVRELGPTFAARASEHDGDDSFVADNYRQLKAMGFFGAHIPSKLGGGGASHAEMCDVLRELAHHCSSTALAFSMHTHLVAAATWRWNNGDESGEGFLRRVAAEDLILVSSGGSDWLQSSGTLVRADDGYRMNGRKVFSSGSPSGDLLVTSGIFDDPASGPMVLHFPLPLDAEGVVVQDNWRTLGMRGTGSNDVLIENAFVPETAVNGKRPVGSWGPFHLVTMVAFPLIYAPYLGVAEAARDLALTHASKRSQQAETQLSVGEMENALRTAQVVHRDMVAIASEAKPSPDTTNEMVIRRTIVGQAAVQAVEKAMEVTGGSAFFRLLGLERLFRDVQAARYHPLTEKRQIEFTGRYTLGLEIE